MHRHTILLHTTFNTRYIGEQFGGLLHNFTRATADRKHRTILSSYNSTILPICAHHPNIIKMGQACLHMYKVCWYAKWMDVGSGGNRN